MNDTKKPTGKGLIGQVGAEPGQTIVIDTGPDPLGLALVALIAILLAWAF